MAGESVPCTEGRNQADKGPSLGLPHRALGTGLHPPQGGSFSNLLKDFT